MKFTYALVASIGIALAFPASSLAQDATAPVAAAAAKAKARAKAKAKAPPKNATQAIISNAQASALTGMQISNAAGKVVAAIKKPVDPGKKSTLKLPAKAGCLFTVSAAFADGSEFDPTEVDLCVDKNIRFTD